jgi:hypothetical protein
VIDDLAKGSMGYAPLQRKNPSRAQDPSRKRPQVHCKLEVGVPDDPLEVEADRTADRIMRLPATVERSDLGERRRESTPVEEVHRKADGGGSRGGQLGASVASSFDQLPRRPMPGQLRNFFEPRFDRSFDDVNLSTGPQAESLAARLGARAFAVGDTIGFARGAFAPNTFAGRWLLAHELTHVSQNGDQPTSRIVRRAPPTEKAKKPSPPVEEQPAMAYHLAGPILAASHDEAVSLIRNIENVDVLEKVRAEVTENLQTFVYDDDHVLFLLGALDDWASEMILVNKFIAKTKSILEGKGATIQPVDMDDLIQWADAMSVPALKRLERKLVLWPKSGVAVRMEKIFKVVTARTRKSDLEESQRGRFDEDMGQQMTDSLHEQTKAPIFEGNKCLSYIDSVGMETLYGDDSGRLAPADAEYRDLWNREANKGGLHEEATLSRLAAELRIQDLVGPVNILPWSGRLQRHDPPPHELFDKLSIAGDGWYFFLGSAASFHTIMVAVHVTAGRRQYFKIDNHGVTRKTQSGLDESFDSQGDEKKNPSRVWQVYVQPAI